MLRWARSAARDSDSETDADAAELFSNGAGESVGHGTDTTIDVDVDRVVHVDERTVRPEHPLLRPDQWEALLASSGFAEPRAIGLDDARPLLRICRAMLASIRHDRRIRKLFRKFPRLTVDLC